MLTGGVDIGGNTFSTLTTDCALRFSNMQDIHIADAPGGSVNVVLDDV